MVNIIEKENLEFRKLNTNDKNLFIKLRFEYFVMDEFDMTGIEKDEIEDNLGKYFDENIENNNFLGIICEHKNKIISAAYLAINKMPPNPHFINGKTGTLLNVFTYPEYRNQGIATELIKKIIEEAKKENISQINLSATKSGEKMYKKLGFKESKYTQMNVKIEL